MGGFVTQGNREYPQADISDANGFISGSCPGCSEEGLGILPDLGLPTFSAFGITLGMLDLAPLHELVNGARTFFLQAHRASDIRAALALYRRADAMLIGLVAVLTVT